MDHGRQVDGSLHDWGGLEIEVADGLLIGNGASRAIWDLFRYSSLYEVARSPDLDHPLSGQDEALFDVLGTTNFERVLEGLLTTEQICSALEHDAPFVRERYDSIRMALVEAVRMVHVRWEDIPQATLVAVASILRNHRYVYTTNYDLLIYWAMMSVNGNGFRDYFFEQDLAFDLSDTEVWDEDLTRVMYLHGALHLFRIGSTAYKRRRDLVRTLLDLFGDPYGEGAIPLFVSEGSSEEKLSSIRSSDYLSYAYNSFSTHSGNLVVFGHSLGPNDQHILNAIRKWEGRDIAVGLLPLEEERVIGAKARLIQECPDAEFVFYDAATHPLGSPDLRVG